MPCYSLNLNDNQTTFPIHTPCQNILPRPFLYVEMYIQHISYPLQNILKMLFCWCAKPWMDGQALGAEYQ